jgi:hypothetical protein
MALNLSPITNAQWLVNLSGTDFYFTTFSGVNESKNPSQYSDPQTNRQHFLPGPVSLDEMTLEVPFDPDVHGPLVDLWQNDACELRVVTVTPVDCGNDPQPISRSISLLDVHLTGLTFGNVDKSSSDTSILSIRFTADRWQYV